MNGLIINCRRHPRYRAVRRKSASRHCPACELLYILRWQHSLFAEDKLGSLNPYQFISGDVEEVAQDLHVRPRL